VRCYAEHARLPGRAEHAAVSVAARLAPFVSPARLHGLYRHLPLGLRARLRGPPSAPGHEDGVHARRHAITATWNALDARLAPSAFLAREAMRYGLDEVLVVPSGLEPGPPHLGGGPFVHLGSVLPHKGVHLVVQAYRVAFGEAIAGPGLVIHGSPDGAPSYASSLGWPLEGTCAPRAVPALLRGATALVMGSTWPENAPLVIMEARAAGCPIIAPRIGGIPEFVEHGRDGLLYPPGDVQALTRCLVEISAAPPRHFDVRPPPSLDDHVARVEAIYHQVLGASPTPASRGSGP
jgi:glycosyltransferase involved in cell wall biosynthesis